MTIRDEIKTIDNIGKVDSNLAMKAVEALQAKVRNDPALYEETLEVLLRPETSKLKDSGTYAELLWEVIDMPERHWQIIRRLASIGYTVQSDIPTFIHTFALAFGAGYIEAGKLRNEEIPL